MKKIGKKTGTLVLWASAYVNLIVFALCGGYVWLKSDDEYLKNETKKALIVSLVFVAIARYKRCSANATRYSAFLILPIFIACIRSWDT